MNVFETEGAAIGIEPRPGGIAHAMLGSQAGSSAEDLRRLGLALGSSALYGLGLGARDGAHAMLVHALGVPAALLLTAACGVPALYILLAHAGSRARFGALWSAAVSGVATAGLVLAGLGPAVALLVVSTEGRLAGACHAALGLGVAGLLGLLRLLRQLSGSLEATDGERRAGASLALFGISVFAAIFTASVWSDVLPVFGALR